MQNGLEIWICTSLKFAAALVDDGGDYHNEADSTNLTSENRALSLFGHDRCWYAFLARLWKRVFRTVAGNDLMGIGWIELEYLSMD